MTKMGDSVQRKSQFGDSLRSAWSLWCSPPQDRRSLQVPTGDLGSAKVPVTCVTGLMEISKMLKLKLLYKCSKMAHHCCSVRDIMCALCTPWRLVGSACHDFDHHMTWGLTTAVRVVLSTTVATESSRVVSSLVQSVTQERLFGYDVDSCFGENQ